MDLLIFVKWLTDFTHKENRAPSVISTMINMALNGGAVDPGTDPFLGTEGTQVFVNLLLLFIALVCVPWMLFIKPFILNKEL
mgnify:CR=1 FL=1